MFRRILTFSSSSFLNIIRRDIVILGRYDMISGISIGEVVKFWSVERRKG
jgi:hypothetical protein